MFSTCCIVPYGNRFLILITYLQTLKIDHHEKYTLSDCSDSGNRLDIRILCIQCRWLDTHSDCTGRYFIDPWPNAQYLDFILQYSKSQLTISPPDLYREDIFLIPMVHKTKKLSRMIETALITLYI